MKILEITQFKTVSRLNKLFNTLCVNEYTQREIMTANSVKDRCSFQD